MTELSTDKVTVTVCSKLSIVFSHIIRCLNLYHVVLCLTYVYINAPLTHFYGFSFYLQIGKSTQCDPTDNLILILSDVHITFYVFM